MFAVFYVCIEPEFCNWYRLQFLSLRHESSLSSPFVLRNVLMKVCMKLKGIVHPKMKILSSFTHTQVVPNCMSFFLLLNIKEDILKNVGNPAVAGPLIWKKTMEVSGDHQLFGCPYLKIFSFMLNRRKKFIFGTPWGQVNDDIFFFGWTTYLMAKEKHITVMQRQLQNIYHEYSMYIAQSTETAHFYPY